MAAMHCNREEVVSIAIPYRRFSDTLAVYLLPRLVLTRTLRLLENRLLGRRAIYSSAESQTPLPSHPTPSEVFFIPLELRDGAGQVRVRPAAAFLRDFAAGFVSALGGTHHHRPSLFADGLAGF